MNRKIIFTQASVLFLITLMISSVIATTQTIPKEESLSDIVAAEKQLAYQPKNPEKPLDGDDLWLHYDDGNYVYGDDSAFGSRAPPLSMAITFTPQELGPFNGLNFTEISWYHVVWNASIQNHTYDVKIYEGTSASPVTQLVNESDIARGQGWRNHTLVTPVEINASRSYWIVIKVYAFNAVTFNDYPLAYDNNDASYYAGKSDWIHNGTLSDFQFYEVAPRYTPPKYGGWLLHVKIPGGVDNVPPITTAQLAGTKVGDYYTSDVTVTLIAQDWASGVNFTKYKIDDGQWKTYGAPFTVTGDGSHTVHFYSKDLANNTETEKTSTFTIGSPCNIEITSITGGFGITVTVNNTGTVKLANIPWNITLKGGFILSGKSKTGTIDIEPGKEASIKSSVFGFGKTTINVTVGCAEKQVSGFVFLFFVLGIK